MSETDDNKTPAENLESNAMDLAEWLDIDAHDIKAAYQDKPESLQAVFNKVSDAKDNGASVPVLLMLNVAGALFAPIALVITAPLLLFALKESSKQKKIENTAADMIKSEIEKTKALPPAPTPGAG